MVTSLYFRHNHMIYFIQSQYMYNIIQLIQCICGIKSSSKTEVLQHFIHCNAPFYVGKSVADLVQLESFFRFAYGPADATATQYLLLQ